MRREVRLPRWCCAEQWKERDAGKMLVFCACPEPCSERPELPAVYSKGSFYAMQAAGICTRMQPAFIGAEKMEK